MELQHQLNTKPKPSRLGLVLAIIFLLLFGIAVIYVFYFAPKTAELSGVILAIFAIPWFFFLLSVHLPTSLSAYEVINLITILIIPVIINAIIIYFLGNFLGRKIHDVNVTVQTAKQVSTDEANKLWKRFNIFFWIFFIIPFSVYLQILFPISSYLIGVISTTHIVAAIGEAITLSYFGYAMTMKRQYLFLGLLGFFPYLSAVALIIGYITIWRLKTNSTRNQYS